MEENKVPGLGLNLGGGGGGAPGLNLNFKLPNLEDLKGNDDSPKAEPFSWAREFEAIEENMVTSREIVDDVDQHNCVAKLVTLEGESFTLECSVAKGIKVVECESKGDFEGNVYESIESLLMRASPLYIQAFTAMRED
jgi:hypothetical protein